MDDEPAPPTQCVACSQAVGTGLSFEIGGEVRCLRCTLTHRPLLTRSGLTAVVVGTLLVAINQGNVLLAGDASRALLWKVPLTYAVPFCVATWGALINSRVGR